MIVEARIGYEMTYFRRGGRRQRTSAVAERVPVKLREIGHADVAASVVTLTGATMRWYMVDGGLYHLHDALMGPPPVAQVLSYTHAANPLWDLPQWREPEAQAETAFADLAVREVVSDGRDAAIAAASARASRMLVLDGGLLTPSLGPRLWFQRRDKESWQVQVDDMPAHRPGIDGRSFSVTDVDEVLAHAADAGMRVENGAAFSCRVEPEAVPLLPSFREQALLAAAANLLDDGIPDRKLANLALPYVAAHLAYTEPDFDRGAVTPELLDLVRMAVEGAVEPGQYVNDAVRSIEDMCLMARVAALAWEARPEAGADAGRTPAPV